MVVTSTVGVRRTYGCRYCRKEFKRSDCAANHERTCDSAPSPITQQSKPQVGGGDLGKFELVDSALRGACTVYRLIFPQGTAADDTVRLREIIMKDVPELVNSKRAEIGDSFKWYLGLKVLFAKANNPDVFTDPPVVFLTNPVISYHSWGLQEDPWKKTEEQLNHKIGNYEKNGSGWILERMLSLDVTVCTMTPVLSKNKEQEKEEEEFARENPGVYTDAGRYDETE